MRKVRAPRTGEWVYSRSIWAWPLVALLLVLCAAPALAQSRITAPGGGGSAIACVGQAATTVLYASSASQCAGDATFTFNDTTKRLSVQNETITSGLTLTGATVTGAPTWSSGQTFPNIILTGVANTALIAASGGSVTGSGTTPFFSLGGTLNTSGSLNAVDWNFTGTASGASTNWFQIRDGATNYFKISKGGAVTQAGGLTVTAGNIALGSSYAITGPTSTFGAEFYGVGGAGILNLIAPMTHTSGNSAMLKSSATFLPASGTGSFASVHINPDINGTSSGTAYGLLLASKTNTLTGGTVRLSCMGTTTTDGFTGFSPQICFETNGAVTQTGVAFASLGTPANGTILFCTTCDPPAAGATAVCTSAGAQTGALALRLNGGWKCVGA